MTPVVQSKISMADSTPPSARPRTMLYGESLAFNAGQDEHQPFVEAARAPQLVQQRTAESPQRVQCYSQQRQTPARHVL